MEKRLTVTDMRCEGCEATVAEALTSVPCVINVDVDHSTGSAIVDGSADTAALLEAVNDAGFEAPTA